MTGAVAQWLAHARNQVKVAIMLWVELQVKALCVSTLVDPTVFIKPLCVQHAQRLLHTLKVPFSPFGKARHYWSCRNTGDEEHGFCGIICSTTKGQSVPVLILPVKLSRGNLLFHMNHLCSSNNSDCVLNARLMSIVYTLYSCHH